MRKAYRGKNFSIIILKETAKNLPEINFSMSMIVVYFEGFLSSPSKCDR